MFPTSTAGDATAWGPTPLGTASLSTGDFLGFGSFSRLPRRSSDCVELSKSTSSDCGEVAVCVGFGDDGDVVTEGWMAFNSGSISGGITSLLGRASAFGVVDKSKSLQKLRLGRWRQARSISMDRNRSCETTPAIKK